MEASYHPEANCTHGLFLHGGAAALPVSIQVLAQTAQCSSGVIIPAGCGGNAAGVLLAHTSPTAALSLGSADMPGKPHIIQITVKYPQLTGQGASETQTGDTPEGDPLVQTRTPVWPVQSLRCQACSVSPGLCQTLSCGQAHHSPHCKCG